MKLTEKRLYILIGGVLLLCLAVVLRIDYAGKITGQKGVIAEVTSVIKRPNMAEDGYYGIKARDSSGHTYAIDATAYLNTPLSPESAGETCVDVPDVRTGDKIRFNLPPSKYERGTYTTCYKTGSGDYFVKRL